MLNYFGGSLRRAIVETYPEHQWKPWRFTRASDSWWSDIIARFTVAVNGSTEPEQLAAVKCVKEFVEDTARDCSVTRLEDWYLVDQDTMGVHRWRKLRELGGLEVVLRHIYPNHPWDSVQFAKRKALLSSRRSIMSSQFKIRNSVNNLLFPCDEQNQQRED